MSNQRKRPYNPFYTTIDIPDEYFCDRGKETQTIVDFIKNGTNIVLKSPRRIGKSSLIMHVFKQDFIKNGYNTLFVDIFGTKNMDDFIQEFQAGFLMAPFARTKRGMKQVVDLFQRIYVQVNFTPGGDLQSARLGLNPSSGYSLTLSEMFDFLEKTKKPNIVVFDEFQKIKDYPEDAAAIIRSYVQKMNNTKFIFSGSSKHMLHNMFENQDEPFYRSATSMDLDIISLPVYSDFCRKQFSEYNKDITKDAVSLAYNLFSGNTYDMQEVMKQAFTMIPEGKTATSETIVSAVNNILDSREVEFREKLDLTDSQKARRLLHCIANEGLATGLTSSSMMKKYGLDNASSVQNAIAYLTDDQHNLVVRIGKGAYCLQNRFFELWLARKNQMLGHKLQNASSRFEAERKLLSE